MSEEKSKEDAKQLSGLTPDSLKVLPPLTDKQAKCLEFILNFFAEHRYYPTQREVAEEMDIRSNTAAMYLAPLIQKGYLLRGPKGHRRNISLTNEALERLQKMGVNVRARLDAA
jgi:DNA-binding MarR family transcriptional regulator